MPGPHPAACSYRPATPVWPPSTQDSAGRPSGGVQLSRTTRLVLDLVLDTYYVLEIYWYGSSAFRRYSYSNSGIRLLPYQVTYSCLYTGCTIDSTGILLVHNPGYY